MQDLNAAYSVLCDSARCREYDRSREQIFRSESKLGQSVVAAAVLGWIWLPMVSRLWSGRIPDVLDVFGAALMSGLMVWPLLWANFYVVTAGSLIIHKGPFRKRVRLSSISRLRAARSTTPAIGLSLERIEIRYGAKVVSVSPRDRQGFVRSILERAPGVEADGSSFARPA